jgi:hypothetical protein
MNLLKSSFNYILIFLIGIILASEAQTTSITGTTSGTRFAPVGAKWMYRTRGCECGGGLEITAEKDSTIIGKVCTLLKFGKDSIWVHSSDTGRVYTYYQNQFKLALNFNVQIGDTFTYFVPKPLSQIWDSEPNSSKYRIDMYISLKIISITSQNFGKTYYSFFSKRQTDDPSQNFTNTSTGININSHWICRYYENIGFHSSLLVTTEYLPQPAGCDFTDANLIYYTAPQKDTVKFFDFCANYVYPRNPPKTSLDTEKDNFISCSPNPVSNVLIVETSKILIDKVEILDIMGRYYEIQFNTENSIQKLNVDFLQSGFYSINIYDLYGKVYQSKFIKTE